MKATGPVLAGCVIGLIAFNMGNSGAGERLDDDARGEDTGVVTDNPSGGSGDAESSDGGASRGDGGSDEDS
jgi:hypothetical protein